MSLLGIFITIFVAGGIGGVVNALITDNGYVDCFTSTGS